MPHADTPAFNAHLAVISNAVVGSHAVIMTDGAGSHIAEKRVVADNITL